MPRLLFCSYHCYFDPSSGAALATRDLFELLASRGWPCEVFCGPQQDFEAQPPLPQLLNAHGLSFAERSCPVGKAPFALFQFRQGGVPVTVFGPVAQNGAQLPARPGAPTREQGYAFLALFERMLEQRRPDVILTYGGQWLAQEMMACAKRHGVRVVFALHNLAYDGAKLFQPVDRVLVPSRFAQAHYRRTLGLECTPIPGPWNWRQLRCEHVEAKYATLVNPQPDKGVFLFARLATELGRLRPDIPLLVVEGRGKANWLNRTGHDLRGLHNLFVMENTPDPRDFYKVSRIVLMPSLCRESFPRVAVESLLNGIPVLGTTRGGLPEPLEHAGFVFNVPARYTPESRIVPTAEEARPWVETIIRLWDGAAFYEKERQRCLAAAQAWRPERLAPRFEEFFTQVVHSSGRPHSSLACG
jgi:glycosyltransferase involved in cell wall biosynthesis